MDEGSTAEPGDATLARTGIDRPAGGPDLVSRAIARFKEVLRAKGARFSTVRNAIARVAIEYDGHFEATDLVRELRARRIKGAHLATVYRALPLLVEAGLIQQAMVSLTDRALYEACFERRHHDHLICTTCGIVVEFELEAIEVAQRELARCHGFELLTHVHELLGRCASCRRTAAARASAAS